MPNWKNRTLFHGDNLDVLRGMDSKTVDLIYLDPPFNKGRDFHAPRGSFQDRWNWEDDVQGAWIDKIQDDFPRLWNVIEGSNNSYGEDMGAYLCFMAVRLVEMKRLLKDTGSIYLHCDPTASHYLKELMDSIFGRQNFRNEIVWGYTGPGSPKMRQFNRKHDVLFWYSHGETWTFNADAVRLPYKDPNQRPRKAFDTGDAFDDANIKALRERGKVPETWWTDIALAVRSSKERVGYPTQKPLALLDRIIKASSNEGDVVLDPFCGCATTCVAAERLKRRWVGIDLWNKAHDIVIERLQREGLAGPDGKMLKGALPLDDGRQVRYSPAPPTRTDDGHEAIPEFKLSPPPAPKAAWEKLTRDKIFENLVDVQGSGSGDVVCAGCARQLEPEFMQLDHAIPRTAGGVNSIDNRVLLCGPCNRRKADRLLLKGLWAENVRTGWMKNRKLAQEMHERAKSRADRLRRELR